MEHTARTVQGVVTKKGGLNTITVRVEQKQPHPIYKKIVRSHTKYSVDISDTNKVAIGDVVTIKQVRPISKRKSWQYVETVAAAA